MACVYQEPEPLVAPATLITVFARFWASDQLIMRRVRALATLDPDLEEAILGRDGWRRNHCRAVIERLSKRLDRPAKESLEDAVDVLMTLLSFETFDLLAGKERDIAVVTPLVRRTVFAALGLDERDGL